MARIRIVRAYLDQLRNEADQYCRHGELTQDNYREILQQLFVVEELFTRLLARESPDRLV